jgi:hypothetical protein
MKPKKPNAELVWKQLEDQVVPRLRLSVIDRTVYSHLLRHSRLEGKLRLRFSVIRLARNIGLTTMPVRNAVRRLAACGALRVVQRSNAGHVVKVRLPDEIPGVRRNRIESPADLKQHLASPLSGLDVPRNIGSNVQVKIEETDFLRSLPLRKAIHARERSQCFYCLRRTTPAVQCLDHVVPQARLGRNSRAPPDRRRTRRPPPRPRRPRLRQAPPFYRHLKWMPHHGSRTTSLRCIGRGNRWGNKLCPQT